MMEITDKSVIESKQKDLDIVRKFLGVTFDNYSYMAVSSDMVQMILKTIAQLHIEYIKYIKLLDTKLNNNEITEEEYDFVYASLSNLYHFYKDELLKKRGNISDFGDVVDFIDEDLLQDEGFLRMFKHYNMMESSEEEIRQFVTEYRKKIMGEEELYDVIEPVDEIDRRM